jgi:hypothetical protein
LFSILTHLQGQNQPLKLSCIFNLDSLPVKFGPTLSGLQANSDDRRSQLNNAIKDLAEVIWRKGGFQFWHRKTYKSALNYMFFSSQDKDRIRQKASKGLRDTSQMERFSCGSYLVLAPSLLDRTLSITLRHTYHKPYENYELSEAVLEFIQNAGRYTTPAEIYCDLQAAQPEG